MRNASLIPVAAVIVMSRNFSDNRIVPGVSALPTTDRTRRDWAGGGHHDIV